jgi:hypothetical protein
MPTQPNARAPIVLRLHNPHPHATLFRVVVHWGSLPDGAALLVAQGNPEQVRKSPAADRKALQRAGVRAANRQATARLSRVVEASRCGAAVDLRHFDVFEIFPDNERRSTLPEILIQPARPGIAAIHLQLPPHKRRNAPPQFDIVQMEGARVVGGCTVLVRGQ